MLDRATDSPVKGQYPHHEVHDIKSEPGTEAPTSLYGGHDTLQTEKLLYLVQRMRQMQENQSPPHSSDTSANLFHPSPPDFGLFRSAFSNNTSSDQPLDFSAAKRLKRDDNSWEDSLHHLHNSNVLRRKQQDTLGSDGHTTGSDTGHHSDLSIHSLHSTHSPPLSIDSPRDGSTNQRVITHTSTMPLPRLSISPPPSTPSPPIDSKDGLLTTAGKMPPATNLFMAGHHPHMPEHPHDMSGLLKLAGIANIMPGGAPGFPMAFLHKPTYPPPLSSSSPLPQGGAHFPPNPESMSELSKLAATSNQKYAEFRDSMLKSMDSNSMSNNLNTSGSRQQNGRRTTPDPGSPTAASTPTTNCGLDSGIDASQGSNTPGSERSRLNKDEAYWERRRKNNEAAKRSRDARRQKETEIAMRAQFLEQENIQLKLELVQIKTQLGSIREQMNRRQIAI